MTPRPIVNRIDIKAKPSTNRDVNARYFANTRRIRSERGMIVFHVPHWYSLAKIDTAKLMNSSRPNKFVGSSHVPTAVSVQRNTNRTPLSVPAGVSHEPT